MAAPFDFTDDLISLDFGSGAFEEFDTHYGLLSPEQTILVRAYSDDTDDRMLAEIQPKFIVMFEPNMEFIRRIEVYFNHNLRSVHFEVRLSRYTRARIRA